MSYGALANWPDYVHTSFGLPFVYATHTSNTIAGPVDTWDVDLNALSADLAFWMVGMVAIVIASLVRNAKMGVSPPPAGSRVECLPVYEVCI